MTQATPHQFDDAIALRRDGHSGDWLGHTSPHYANMVGPFGGTTAAQALNAVLLHPDRLGDPIALTVNFCAPVADGPFTITARAARTNRSTQHWVVEILQGAGTVMTATAITAVRRSTWSANDSPMPTVPAPLTMPEPEGTRPLMFLNQYEQRFVAGNFPTVWDGREGQDSLTQLWLRDKPARPLDFASLTAMADIFIPRIFLRRAKPTAAGSVSITTYFHANAQALQDVGTGFLLGQARAHAFHDGFFDQTAHLWSEQGRLMVSTHQIVYFKD